jgi:hypothetical protein
MKSVTTSRTPSPPTDRHANAVSIGDGGGDGGLGVDRNQALDTIP